MGGYATTPIGATVPYDPSTNPEDIWANERLSSVGSRDILDQQIRDQQNTSIGREDEAYQRTQQLYWELLSDPGLSPDEKAAILQEAELQGLQFSPEEIASFGLQDYEQDQIRGDPWNALNTYYNPQSYDEMLESGASRTRDAVGGLRTSMNEAIDPDRLRQDPNYRAQVMAELERAGAATSEATGDPGLDVTERYLAERGYTDADVAAMGESASRDIGLRHQAAITDAERAAMAAGLTDPQAMAAIRQRLELQASPLATDARMDAELAALEKQKLAEQDIQDTQLGAAGTRAGLRSGVALDLAGLRTGVLSDAERARISAEQGLTGFRTDAARTTGLAALDNERDIRDAATRGEEVKWATAIPAAERAEQAGSGRAAGIAENRQGVVRDVAGNRQTTSRANIGHRADANMAFANARRGDVDAVRKYYLTQQGMAGDAAAESMANRIGLQGQIAGQTQGAASGQQAWQGRRKWWHDAINTGINAAVGAATGGFSNAAQAVPKKKPGDDLNV